MVLVAVFQPSWGAGSEESVGSLEDVITQQDQARLAKVLQSAEPYNSLEDAYNVARGVSALGVTDSTRKVIQRLVCTIYEGTIVFDAHYLEFLSRWWTTLANMPWPIHRRH